MDVNFSFSLNNLGSFLVHKEDIPGDYWKLGGNKAVETIEHMFFCGGQFTKKVAKTGIDARTAILHIYSVLNTNDPGFPHEYKTACCAYLMDTWFSEYEFQAND